MPALIFVHDGHAVRIPWSLCGVRVCLTNVCIVHFLVFLIRWFYTCISVVNIFCLSSLLSYRPCAWNKDWLIDSYNIWTATGMFRPSCERDDVLLRSSTLQFVLLCWMYVFYCQCQSLLSCLKFVLYMHYVLSVFIMAMMIIIITIIIAVTMFMVLSSWPAWLREFTRFIWWMQTVM